MELIEAPETSCICGGRFRLDVQYLLDARRFGFSDLPVLWRCSMCGRSLTDRPATPPRGETAIPDAAENDPCGEDLLDEATGALETSPDSRPTRVKIGRTPRRPSRAARSRPRRSSIPPSSADKP